MLAVSLLALGALIADPYAALGLRDGATAAQIRKAFRNRARALHPDVSNDPNAADHFRELVGALEAIQAGATFQPILHGPQTQTPGGMPADERVNWFISHNKVLLFMRGTKQQPSRDCPGSAMAVCTLSSVAFDTNTRFAAVDVDPTTGDEQLRDAVLGRSGKSKLPLCYIDGQLIGGPEDVDALWESGELMRAFGGEQLVAPRELQQWQDGKLVDADEPQRKRRAHRNLVHGGLEWYVLLDDGNWHSERNVYDAKMSTMPQPAATSKAAKTEPEPEDTVPDSDAPADAGDAVEEESSPIAVATDSVVVTDSSASPIEAVVAYRTKYGNEQWQVRWGETDETGEGVTSWERWELVDTPALRKAAKELRREVRAAAQ